MGHPPQRESETSASGTAPDASAVPAHGDTVVEALGIIAGKGAYPLILARSARAQGVKRLFAVAFKGETDKGIANVVDEVHWQHVGQLAPFLDAFERSGVRGAVMAGQITPRNLFNLRFDKAMREMLASLERKNADTIFGAIGDRLRGVGVELLPASAFMESEMPGAGVLTTRAPNEQERADLDHGFHIAKVSSGERIGQTVVIKDGVVLAVEAFEGTDKAILRGGKLGRGRGEKGGGGGVVVKVAMADHDMRFDIPVVGLKTLKSIAKADVTALGIEAGRTILLEREAVLAEANRMGLSIEARKVHEV